MSEHLRTKAIISGGTLIGFASAYFEGSVWGNVVLAGDVFHVGTVSKRFVFLSDVRRDDITFNYDLIEAAIRDLHDELLAIWNAQQALGV